MKYVYPQGKEKALTFSYDDGQEYDRKLVGIFNKYGMKATFHLNSGTIGHHAEFEEFITTEEVATLYEGHEVACHGVEHKNMTLLSKTQIAKELFEDRKSLEQLTGKIVQGLSYAYGKYNEDVLEVVKSVGIKYSRAVAGTMDFHPPVDFLQWTPTCHHSQMLELADRFLDVPGYYELPLMYVWGHSFEFGRPNEWDSIEKFCEKMSGKSNIWYATNMEIYNYITAVRNLECSADGSVIYNPSAISVWFLDDDGNLVELMGGCTYGK